MAIHYKDHERFSRGQGFVGAACRPISAQATSKRWFAVDCRDCKDTLMGRWISSDGGTYAYPVTAVQSDGVWARQPSGAQMFVSFRYLDKGWSPAVAGGEAGK